MSLPASGALSMSQINTEFGRGNNLNSYRGTTYSTATGSTTFPAGTISFSNFYGTANPANVGITWQRGTQLNSIWGGTGAAGGAVSVAHNGSVFLAGGNQGVTVAGSKFLTSSNGVTWTDRTTALNTVSGSRTPVYVGGGAGVSFAQTGASGGLLCRSLDNGASWSQSTGFPGSTSIWNEFATNGSGIWVAGGSSPLLGRSTNNGAAFSNISTSIIGTSSSTSKIIWNGSLFFVVGRASNNTAVRGATSPDGVTWTNFQAALQTALGAGRAATGAAWNGSFFLVIGTLNTSATSPNGVTWTTRTGLSAVFGSAANTIQTVIWCSNSSVFVATGPGSTCATSPDGINWTQRTGLSGSGYVSAPTTFTGGIFYPMAYNGGRLLLASWSTTVPGDTAYSPA